MSPPTPPSARRYWQRVEARGCRMLVKNRTEPWGQTVSRLLSPEGFLLRISFTPALRDPPAR